ncbi:hypothetical protein [Virgibacillus sp. DJP39]|uniref:hypothetical protein n=1 Tax=Virgibacillus sp. DJP39 TaxID=3409790 RepID=UPI003BB5CE6C
MKKRLDELRNSLKDKGVTLAITSDLFLLALQKTMNKNNEIGDLTVSFDDGYLTIVGNKKVLFRLVKFYARLRPVDANGRVLTLKLEEAKPVKWNWLSKVILNRPPFMKFSKEVIKIDLNSIDKIRAVPIGNIIKFEIKDKILWVKVGL